MMTTRSILSAFLSSVFLLQGRAADLKLAGVPNLHKVSGHVYRSAQPLNSNWKQLADLGITTVIDLRPNGENRHSVKAEADEVGRAGMRYINVPIRGRTTPDLSAISKILAVLNENQTVLVHCRLGKDRTGTVIACYRIAHDRWANEAALEEAKHFGMHWSEFGMKNYILQFKAVSDYARPFL